MVNEIYIGKIVSYFTAGRDGGPGGGYGFVRLYREGVRCPPGCTHHQSLDDCEAPSFYFHIMNSPELDEITLRMLVTFRLENVEGKRPQAVGLRKV